MTNKRRVLIDTDAIYASFVEADIHHKRAQSIKKNFPSLHFIITDFVFGEAATLLARRVEKPTADIFLKGFAEHEFVLITASRNIIVLAVDFFLRQITKDTSFVDCVNMATAKRFGIDTIFSFDKVYERNGFKLLAPR